MSDAERATSLGPEDAETVFLAMQARLDELQRLPIVRNDAVARGLLDDMARSVTPDDLVALLDQLEARVRLLLARKSRVAPSDTARRERAPRTLLRL